MTTVTIVDQREQFRDVVAAALVQEGFTLEWPHDVESWSAGDRRVAIIDVTDPEGADLLQRLSASDSDVVVLGLVNGQTAQAYADALRSGASNVVSKHAHPYVIVDAVHAALTGQVVLPTAVVCTLTSATDPSASRPHISKTDVKLLRLMAAGLSMAKIAVELHVSERTLYREAKRLMNALRASTRAEALVKAAQWGFLSDE